MQHPRRSMQSTLHAAQQLHRSAFPARPAVTPQSPCRFLDALPPELRLMIYSYLLVAGEPLCGRASRNGRQYGLSLAILRTSRFICEEARAVFYAKNVFVVGSAPDAHPSICTRDAEGRLLDPPLPPEHLPLIRHLSLDLLYRGASTPSLPAPSTPTWPIPGIRAAAYSTSAPRTPISINGFSHSAASSLIALLGSVPHLQTLHLIAAAPRPFCARTCLASIFACDRDRGFSAALAALPHVQQVALSFEFTDCYYRTIVDADAFLSKSILLLACQVLFCQSQVSICRMLREFDEVVDEGDGERAEAWMEDRERVDLEPLVSAWPARVPGLKEVVRQARELVAGENVTLTG